MNASGNARVSSSTIYVYSKTKIHIFIGFIDKKFSYTKRTLNNLQTDVCIILSIKTAQHLNHPIKKFTKNGFDILL